MKIQVHNSLESPLEYNHDQIALTSQDLLRPFLTIVGVTEILCGFRLVVNGNS